VFFFLAGRMVLVLSGVLQEEAPPDTRTLFHNHPVYKDSAAQLLAIPTKVMGPVGLLYVKQRELAVTVPHDSTCQIWNLCNPRAEGGGGVGGT
jgi:protein N-terminal asparagine amidohydrolase